MLIKKIPQENNQTPLSHSFNSHNLIILEVN